MPEAGSEPRSVSSHPSSGDEEVGAPSSLRVINPQTCLKGARSRCSDHGGGGEGLANVQRGLGKKRWGSGSPERCSLGALRAQLHFRPRPQPTRSRRAPGICWESSAGKRRERRPLPPPRSSPRQWSLACARLPDPLGRGTPARPLPAIPPRWIAPAPHPALPAPLGCSVLPSPGAAIAGSGGLPEVPWMTATEGREGGSGS